MLIIYWEIKLVDIYPKGEHPEKQLGYRECDYEDIIPVVPKEWKYFSTKHNANLLNDGHYRFYKMNDHQNYENQDVE